MKHRVPGESGSWAEFIGTGDDSGKETAGLQPHGESVRLQRDPADPKQLHQRQHARLPVVFNRVLSCRTPLQPHRAGGPHQRLQKSTEPLEVFLLNLPLRPGVDGFSRPRHHLVHRPDLPPHRVPLARSGPRSAPLQVPGIFHGLFRALPAAAGSHHGSGEVSGHKQALPAFHQRLKTTGLVLGLLRLALCLLHRHPAHLRPGALRAPVAQFLVFLQHDKQLK